MRQFHQLCGFFLLTAGLALSVSCFLSEGPRTAKPDRYFVDDTVSPPDDTRYPVFVVKNTDSLFAVVREELEIIRRNYPGYRIEGLGGSLYGIRHNYDRVWLTRPNHPDLRVLFDLAVYDEKFAHNTKRMTKEEALAIARLMAEADILAKPIPPNLIHDDSAWEVNSGGTLDVRSPEVSPGVRYEWEFGDWVLRLYKLEPQKRK